MFDGIFKDGPFLGPLVMSKVHTNFYQMISGTGCSGSKQEGPVDITIKQGNAFYDLAQSGQWYKYGLEWSGTTLKYYLNDYLIRTVTSPAFGYHQKLILTHQIKEVSNCDYSKKFLIEYVRVYTKLNKSIHFNTFPANGEICKTNAASFGVDVYPSATGFSWSCSALTFTCPTCSWTTATVNSTTQTGQSYPVSVTVTYNVNGNVFSETLTSSVYIVNNTAPPMPGTIFKRQIGTSCYYQAYVSSIAHVTSYSWKEGNGSYLADDNYYGEFDPNSTVTLSVKAKNVCNLESTPKTQTLTFGNPPPGCTWREVDPFAEFVISSEDNETLPYGPFRRVIVYDLLGKINNVLIDQESPDVIDRISHSNLADGIYIIALENVDGRFFKTKIIVDNK